MISSGPAPYKNAATGYEKYLTQRVNLRLKFQLITASLILAISSPFALPIALLKARHIDEGFSASFDTIISAAYIMTIGTVLTLAHAKYTISSYDSRVHNERMGTTEFIFSGPASVKGAYLSGVSKACTWMNAACATTFAAGVSTLLFQFYPTGTIAVGTMAIATILVESIASQIKQGTLLKGNTLSAVSNIRGAVAENKLGNLVPAL